MSDRERELLERIVDVQEQAAEASRLMTEKLTAQLRNANTLLRTTIRMTQTVLDAGDHGHPIPSHLIEQLRESLGSVDAMAAQTDEVIRDTERFAVEMKALRAEHQVTED